MIDEEPTYVDLLYQQNEELELMLQSQSEEIERLQHQLAMEKMKVRKLRYAGRSMGGFLDEMIGNDVFHDEVYDEAEKVLSRWESAINSLSSKRSRK